MISVYKIKPAFQKALQPILKALHQVGITANQLTIAAILFSIGLGVLFLYHGEYRFVLWVFAVGMLFRMALNALDGMMARQFQMQSQLGELLNEIGDILSDLAIILPLATITGINQWIIIAFALLAVINEYAGLLGKAMGGERRYDGPMGKSDRALLIGLFCLIWYFWDGLSLYTDWIFGIGGLLMVISTFVRLRKALS